jgi:membrane fusion protein, multidrug efflux system
LADSAPRLAGESRQLTPVKRIVSIVVCLAVVAGLAWLVWFKRAKPEEAEQKPETEVPVQVGKLKRVTLHGYVTAYGTVEPEPAGERPAASAHVSPFVPGVVTEVKCVAGQRVDKGALLFQLDTRAADVAVDYAKQTLARQRKLAQVESASQKTLQEAEQQLAAAQAQRALLQVQSPLAGTVIRVNVKPGEAVDLTSMLAEVIDLDRLVVKTGIPTPQTGELKLGQEKQVLSPPTVTATLSFISPAVDTNNGTVLAWAALPPGSGLRPGQFVPVRIITAVHSNCLAAPEESVATDIHDHSVLALVNGDEAAPAPVETGLRENGWVEVKGAGLKEGDAVVTVGAYGLPEKTKIRVVSR